MIDAKMTIHDIVRDSNEHAPYFFSVDTLEFFGQTIEDFEVEEQADGRFKISAPAKGFDGKYTRETVRYFNPETNKLDLK